jgi:hypothetical protein
MAGVSFDAFSAMIPHETFDILAIGVSETMRYIPSSKFFFCMNSWEETLDKCIGKRYAKIGSSSIQGIKLAIFSRLELRKSVYEIKTQTVALGLHRWWGNKGSAAIAFRLSSGVASTSFLFINSHFCAGESKLQQRNKNYRDTEICLTLNDSISREKIASNRFDVTVWMGDLNYRIQGVGDGVFHRLQQCEKKSKEFESILEYLITQDELRRGMNNGLVFSNFSEGEIRFPPTYKYDLGTSNFDSSAKRRIPSWTDRILFKASTAAVKILDYASLHDITTSDHKPVIGILEVDQVESERRIPVAISRRMCFKSLSKVLPSL